MRVVRGTVACVAVAAAVVGVVVAVTGGAASAAAAPGAYTVVTPTRVLDTRIGLGAPKAVVPGLGAISVPVAGQAGVPASGASAVQVTVTVTATQATGFLTVWPHGSPRPEASTLNFVSGITVANSATVMVPAGGALDFFNGSHAGVHVIADVSGYYTGGVTTAAGTFASLAPARVLDTRTSGGAIAAQGTVRVHVAGSGGVPATGVGAVVLNLTAANPTQTGFLTAWDGGAHRPGTSSLNFVAGSTVANQAIVPVGADGSIGIFNGSATGTVQAIADVAGWFRAGAPTTEGAYQVLTPVRILDTRQVGSPGIDTPSTTGMSTTLFAGEGGVPTSGVTAVAINVTVTGTTATGNLTVHADGTTRPGTSNLNWVANQTVADLVLAPVGGSTGKITFSATTQGSLKLIVDVVGYVRGATPAAVPAIHRVSTPALTAPLKVVVDAAGNRLVAEGENGVRQVAPDGAVSTLVPGPAPAVSCAATGDGGPAAQACAYANDLALGPDGTLYIADKRDARVRKVTTGGTISTVAGTGSHNRACGDGGPATAACLIPYGVAVDQDGRLFIADAENVNVRRVDTDGTITRYAGPQLPPPGDPRFCTTPSEGEPANVQCVGEPDAVALDGHGNLYFTSSLPLGANRQEATGLFRVDGTGALFHILRNGLHTYGDGGPARSAGAEHPVGVVADGAGTVYVSHSGYVRRVDAAGRVTTVAGAGPLVACTDATATTAGPATCLLPGGLTLAADGTLLIADGGNDVLWALTPPA
jgi:sugar lactone lactonase YvrE